MLEEHGVHPATSTSSRSTGVPARKSGRSEVEDNDVVAAAAANDGHQKCDLVRGLDFSWFATRRDEGAANKAAKVQKKNFFTHREACSLFCSEKTKQKKSARCDNNERATATCSSPAPRSPPRRCATSSASKCLRRGRRGRQGAARAGIAQAESSGAPRMLSRTTALQAEKAEKRAAVGGAPSWPLNAEKEKASLLAREKSSSCRAGRRGEAEAPKPPSVW